MMPAERVERALETRVIEIAPLAYMRGRTLGDSFVIVDEAQNATAMQMKMLLTRLGVNSKMGITGGKTQRVPLSRAVVAGVVRTVLRAERVAHALLSVRFLSRRQIAALNRRHLGHR